MRRAIASRRRPVGRAFCSLAAWRETGEFARDNDLKSGRVRIIDGKLHLRGKPVTRAIVFGELAQRYDADLEGLLKADASRALTAAVNGYLGSRR